MVEVLYQLETIKHLLVGLYALSLILEHLNTLLDEMAMTRNQLLCL